MYIPVSHEDDIHMYIPSCYGGMYICVYLTSRSCAVYVPMNTATMRLP
jgi:hypothetical protein